MIDRLFQVLITDGSTDEARFTDTLRRNIASLKAAYPAASYTRYDNARIEAFLRDRFAPEVLAAYQALTPYAYRADLARFCLLYEFGGLYSDLSVLHLAPLRPERDTSFIAFRDLPGHPPWATSTALLFARPRLPALRRAIDRIVLHHQTRYYGQSPLDPTGPYLLGRVLAEGEDWATMLFGETQYRPVAGSDQRQATKLLPSGQAVACKNKQINCSIGELVRGQSNNYDAIWQARRVWGEAGFVDRLKNAVRRR